MGVLSCILLGLCLPHNQIQTFDSPRTPSSERENCGFLDLKVTAPLKLISLSETHQSKRSGGPLGFTEPFLYDR